MSGAQAALASKVYSVIGSTAAAENSTPLRSLFARSPRTRFEYHPTYLTIGVDVIAYFLHRVRAFQTDPHDGP